LRQSEADRERLAQAFRLAEQAGARTVTLAAHDVSEEILAFARSQNVTKIVVGKPHGSRWRYRLFGSLVDELIRGSHDIDVYVIRGTGEEGTHTPTIDLGRRSPATSYAWAVLLVAAITLLAHAMFPYFELTNVVMVYLLGVLVTAALWGRGPSIAASILSVAAFDFFFVPPRLTFAVSDTQYVVTFGVMLAVALLTSTLTVRLRAAANSYRRRQEQTAALYRMSREFARSVTTEEVVQSAERHIGDVFASEVWIFVPDANGQLVNAPGVTSVFPLEPKEMEVARWAFNHKERAGQGTATLSGARALYVPLVGSRGSVGVIGLFATDERRPMSPDQLRHLEAFADQTALVIERALLVRESEESKLRIETERLRNLLLSSVSHDLRTPLATITGAASTLLQDRSRMSDETRIELTQSIVDEADRLNSVIGNLLTMTRLESGAMQVSKEWQPLEEVVGVALTRMEAALADRPVNIRIPADLGLVPLDGVLIEKVLLNLIDNAVKYTPPDQPIEVAAWRDGDDVIIEVSDHGPGLPEGDEERVFEKFYRGAEGDRRGVGLGLPICRGIVEAHGGRIWARNNPGGGVAFRFLLPGGGARPEQPIESEA
jgi:two-component system sensor histidine kinase KdpD